MLLRILDRFEEILISALMALAVVLIFVAVVHRFSIGFAADLPAINGVAGSGSCIPSGASP